MSDTNTPACPFAGGDHNFSPKRRAMLPITVGAKTGSTEDISELFCIKCGQVMLLQGREYETKITPVRLT